MCILFLSCSNVVFKLKMYKTFELIDKNNESLVIDKKKKKYIYSMYITVYGPRRDLDRAKDA